MIFDKGLTMRPAVIIPLVILNSYCGKNNAVIQVNNPLVLRTVQAFFARPLNPISYVCGIRLLLHWQRQLGSTCAARHGPIIMVPMRFSFLNVAICLFHMLFTSSKSLAPGSEKYFTQASKCSDLFNALQTCIHTLHYKFPVADFLYALIGVYSAGAPATDVKTQRKGFLEALSLVIITLVMSLLYPSSPPEDEQWGVEGRRGRCVFHSHVCVP